MRSNTSRSTAVGDIAERGINAVFVGFMAAVCRWFAVTPEGFKRPGSRPNSPPPSGGVSSLG